jgi:hypothetical protein
MALSAPVETSDEPATRRDWRGGRAVERQRQLKPPPAGVTPALISRLRAKRPAMRASEDLALEQE